jgi:hypothetical protein
MDRSAASQMYLEKISEHHANEVYARGCARTTISRLRKMQIRELAQDRPYLVGLSQVYKIDVSHVTLFVEMVEELIDADRIPRRYQREQNRVAEQQVVGVPNPSKWLSLEQQRAGVKV